MEDSIPSLLLIGIGIVVGWFLREWYAVRKLEQLKEVFEQMQHNDEDKIPIVVEIKDKQLFVYERDTLKYLAHGSNEKDVTKILKERFPGKVFEASPEDLLKLTSFQNELL